jgi:hypothetical protein
MKSDLNNEIQSWIARSKSAFDVLICKSEQLRNDCTIMDTETLDRLWRGGTLEWVGAIPINRALVRLQCTSHRVTRRMAKLNTRQFGISANGLTNAWFSPVISELATLIPIRHMARKIAAKHDGRLIAIPLKSRSFIALNAWSTNELEPLYLAYELRRKKVPVVLFIESEGAPAFHFRLSNTWLRKKYPQVLCDKNATTVICKQTIRRAVFVKEQSGAKRKHKPGCLTLERYLGINRKPNCLTLDLQSGPSFGDVQSFSAPSDTPRLDLGFVELLGPLTKKVTHWYRKEFKKSSLLNAHIADHGTFEGGLLAAEAVRKGGQITIWPHSANLVHMFLHDPKEVARVTVAAKSTGVHWANTFTGGKVVIDIRSLIPKTVPCSSFDSSRPIHVVLFAGAHALKRMPLVDYERHKATWRRVLEGFQNSEIDLTIKHKSTFETRDWITSLAPAGSKLNFSRTHANNLKLPNMVFMSISMTSTAILEGIPRGIPGVTVRDVLIDETPYYDPEFVPRLTSDKVVGFIENLNSKAAMDDLRERQRTWFERETDSSYVFDPQEV